MKAHLRIARPTSNMEKAINFYRDGLDFEMVGSFNDHAGFNGVMFANPGANYHIEITEQIGHNLNIQPTEEDLLVFYIPEKDDWLKHIERLEKLGYKSLKSNNPYWDVKGRTFEDEDGYRIVLQNSSSSID